MWTHGRRNIFVRHKGVCPIHRLSRHPLRQHLQIDPTIGLDRVHSAHVMRRDDLLDLNDVLQHPGRELAVDISTELPEEADVELLKPLEGILEAVSTGNILLITGSFNTRVVLDCARCSGPLEVDITFEVNEQFPVEGIPSSLSPQDFARVVPDEPFQLFEGNDLIVEQLLRQALHIALPMQSLCEFGWDGECPIAKARGIANIAAPAGRPEFGSLSNLLQPGDSES